MPYNTLIYTEIIMYQQVETDKEIVWDSEGGIQPVATLADEYGGRLQIVVDDHCFVLLINHKDFSEEEPKEYYCPSSWWNKEAVKVLKTLSTNLLD